MHGSITVGSVTQTFSTELNVDGYITAINLVLTEDMVARNTTLFGDLRVGSGSGNYLYVQGTSQFEFDSIFNENVLIKKKLDAGSLEVAGNTVLGTNCTNTLNVKSTSVFDCDTTFNGSLTLGSDCSKTLHVKSTSFFDCDVTFKGKVNFGPDSNLIDTILLGDTVIGDGCATSSLLIQAATTVKCDILPDPDNTVNLGSSTKRFANVYTGDLHFNNEGSKGNDVDGTTGSWTLQEGDESMFFINNNTGAKFRVVMEPVG